MTENKIQEAVIDETRDKNNNLLYSFYLPENEKWMMLCKNEKLKTFIEEHKNELHLCPTVIHIRQKINMFLKFKFPLYSEEYNEKEKEEYEKQLKIYLNELISKAKFLDEKSKPFVWLSKSEWEKKQREEKRKRKQKQLRRS